MMKHKYRMNGAHMHGKICTALLDLVMFIFLLFPDLSEVVVTGLTVICIISILVSFALYLRMYYHAWKDISR